MFYSKNKFEGYRQSLKKCEKQKSDEKNQEKLKKLYANKHKAECFDVREK